MSNGAGQKTILCVVHVQRPCLLCCEVTLACGGGAGSFSGHQEQQAPIDIRPLLVDGRAFGLVDQHTHRVEENPGELDATPPNEETDAIGAREG
eukprot:2785724-Pyramimonas_sp.AAC.1